MAHLSTAVDPLSAAVELVEKRSGWTPRVASFQWGQFFYNLGTLGRIDVLWVARKLAEQHNKLAKASTAPLSDGRIARLEKALETERLERTRVELSLRELQARCDVLTERYQAAIDSQVAALKDHFGGSFANLAAARDEIVASAAQARDGAAQAAALLDELKDEFSAAREVIPQLANTAVREVVAAVQEEPSILALALGNAERFTSTIAKTVER